MAKFPATLDLALIRWTMLLLAPVVLLLGCGPAPVEDPTDQPADPVDVSLIQGQVGHTQRVHTFGENFWLCSQPQADDLATLAQLGVRTVINLRQPDELTSFDEQRIAEQLGMAYHNPGFGSAASLTDEIFDQTLTLLTEEQHQPLLLHCGSGNRVGAIWLAHRVINDGLTFEAALEEAIAVGMRPEQYEQRVRDYLVGRQ